MRREKASECAKEANVRSRAADASQRQTRKQASTKSEALPERRRWRADERNESSRAHVDVTSHRDSDRRSPAIDTERDCDPAWRKRIRAE